MASFDIGNQITEQLSESRDTSMRTHLEECQRRLEAKIKTAEEKAFAMIDEWDDEFDDYAFPTLDPQL